MKRDKASKQPEHAGAAKQPQSRTSDKPDVTASRPADRDKSMNPLMKLRFGSAGSGGAEREPGPEKP